MAQELREASMACCLCVLLYSDGLMYMNVLQCINMPLGIVVKSDTSEG